LSGGIPQVVRGTDGCQKGPWVPAAVSLQESGKKLCLHIESLNSLNWDEHVHLTVFSVQMSLWVWKHYIIMHKSFRYISVFLLSTPS
jgi:hypothetical protein